MGSTCIKESFPAWQMVYRKVVGAVKKAKITEPFTKVAFLNRPTKHASRNTHYCIIWLEFGCWSAFFVSGPCALIRRGGFFLQDDEYPRWFNSSCCLPSFCNGEESVIPHESEISSSSKKNWIEFFLWFILKDTWSISKLFLHNWSPLA